MVVCNYFEASVTVSGDDSPVVDFVIRTDLPAGTQVIYSCCRTYQDSQGEESLWVGHGDTLVVSLHGECCGRIDIIASDTEAARLFQQINTSYSPPGISAPISDTVKLQFVVGGRQRLKEFGRYNAHLSGSLVEDRGRIKVVKATRELYIPMKSALRPL